MRREASDAVAEKFIDELVYGLSDMPPDDIGKMFRGLGLKSHPNFAMCVGISGFGAVDTPRREKIRMRGLRALRKLFPDRRRSLVAFLHQNCFYVLGRMSRDFLGRKAALAALAVSKIAGLRATAGVEIVPSIEKMQTLIRNAVVARRYEFLGLPQDVFWPDDVKSVARETSRFYRESEGELASAIRFGDAARAAELARGMAMKLAAGRLHVMAAIRIEMLGLVFVASRAALDAGIKSEAIVKINTECMRRITGTHDLKELAELATGAAAELAGMARDLHRGRRSPIVERAKEHIRKNFAEKITLSQLARAAFSSPCHLSRTFKAEEGVSFVDFLNSVRVEEAKKLLADPDMSVTDVCFAVGFGSLNQFERIFKKAAGLTPSAFHRPAKI